MRVLVVGGGGREHALAWRIRQDPQIDAVFVAPGNDGIALEPGIQCVPISVANHGDLLAFVEKNKIDFVVVGPDQALADGIVDRFSSEGVAIFGPTAAAARLESSKAFAKEVMQQAGIPTARFQVFHIAAEAKKFLDETPWTTGWALKADGLALGKGVVVTSSRSEAEQTIDEFMLGGRVGEAGKTIVIEERLQGREVSAFYLCDGSRAWPLGNACDYKQLRDGGAGPNTGGMGAFAPADWLVADFNERVTREIVGPLLLEMRERGVPYRGVLYVGLMVTESGPKVIEFNARFGDPETQALLPLLEGNFTKALHQASRGLLPERTESIVSLRRAFAVHVTLAAAGYPGSGGELIRKGDRIELPADLLEASTWEDGKIFFAGVQGNADDLRTNGGRVLGLTALARTRTEARAKAYAQIGRIHFAGAQLRSDVGG